MAVKPFVYWYPAAPANFTPANRPYSGFINSIVIHMTQGSYASAMSWFQVPGAASSSHYTVRSYDGIIGQSVSDINIAWHAGNWWFNAHSIGIEHEGYVDNPNWLTEPMTQSSARLAAYLCLTYGIPIDRYHIFGHDEVPGSTHTDPGYWWNWDYYMYLVAAYAGY